MDAGEEDWSVLVRWAQVNNFDGSSVRLAEACGVTQGTVSKWVNRQRAPGRDKIGRYAEGLGVPFERAALAASRVVVDKELPIRTRLAESEAERDRLREEVARLRARLPDSQ